MHTIKIKELFYSGRFWSMVEGDLTVCDRANNGKNLFIFTGAVPSRIWPKIIEVEGKLFQFESNEAMPREAVGHYLGYAKYTRLV